MKRGVMVIIVAITCQILLISSAALASLPVKYKSEGCVVGGQVFNLYQGKRQYTFDLPKGFNLSPYEGKKVMLEGDMYPADYFVPKDNTLKIMGPCYPGAEKNAPVPAKPVAQPAKPVQQQPVKPVVQSATPVQSQPAKPVAQPAKPVQQQPAKPVVQPVKPAQPTAASPASKPAQQPQNLANCRQNCQRQYDAKIQSCAGYKLGNTARACKDPIERDKNSCLNSCR